MYGDPSGQPLPPPPPAGLSGVYPARVVEPAPGRPQRVGWALWVLLLLITLLVLPTLAERIEYAITRGRVNAEADGARERIDENNGGMNLGMYRTVAKAIHPSVVGVKATRLGNNEPSDELSFMLFGRRPQMREQDQGSGVIIDDEGYIVTNYHIISRASEVSVELSDGSRHPAKIVNADPATDLAVLKIGPPGLRAAKWGDSDALEVGDPVMAIGNPFGLMRTVTAGIISAKGRHAVIQNVDYQDFLQTDAAVNPGNSGGPLVNMKGEVIGINTAIVGPTYQGISFAIPSKMAEHVYDKLKRGEKVTRGWLGVSMQELTPELAEKLDLKSTNGALVAGVLPNGPAADAGLKPGDVIVRWNGKPINDPNELALAVAWTEIGSKADVLVIRNGQEQTFSIKVGERPERLR